MPSSGSSRTGALRGVTVAVGLIAGVRVSVGVGVVGLTLFASPLGAAIVDWLGFEPLFLFSLACGLIAVVLSLGLEEPRKRQIAAN